MPFLTVLVGIPFILDIRSYSNLTLTSTALLVKTLNGSWTTLPSIARSLPPVQHSRPRACSRQPALLSMAD